MQTDLLLDPRRRGGAPARPPGAAAASARSARSSGCAAGTASLGPDSVAATDLSGLRPRLSREFARAAIGDRDLAERYLDRADNGFLAHVTSPWRWHSHLLELWAEGDEELIGRPWDELVARRRCAAPSTTSSSEYGPDTEGWRWGSVHELRFPHALGDVNPAFDWVFNRTLRVGGGQETVTQVAYDPNDPYEAIWAPAWRMVADPPIPTAPAGRRSRASPATR